MSSDFDHPDESGTYWPTDLLPAHCPQVRIMVWGYDSMVTRGPREAANKSGIFAQGQNLLYSLSRERTQRKPIIFVAHSLGGILVKEMISYADASKERDFLEIVEDISAVVFLGAPHRGSDAARIGDIARRIASALRVQQSFARIWDERRFDVKTFQESKGVIGVKIGMLNELVCRSCSPDNKMGHQTVQHPLT
jgi:hypothetical protein